MFYEQRATFCSLRNNYIISPLSLCFHYGGIYHKFEFFFLNVSYFVKSARNFLFFPPPTKLMFFTLLTVYHMNEFIFDFLLPG